MSSELAPLKDAPETRVLHRPACDQALTGVLSNSSGLHHLVNQPTRMLALSATEESWANYRFCTAQRMIRILTDEIHIGTQRLWEGDLLDD